MSIPKNGCFYNKCTKQLSEAEEYWEGIFTNNETNIIAEIFVKKQKTVQKRKQWLIITEEKSRLYLNTIEEPDCLCNKSRPSTEIKYIQQRNGKINRDKRQMTEDFNEYFSSIAEKYAEKIKKTANLTETLTNLQSTLDLYGTTVAKVETIINVLRNWKGTRYDTKTLHQFL